jgi:hypothetical protein
VNVSANEGLFKLLYKVCCELLFFDEESTISTFLIHYQLTGTSHSLGKLRHSTFLSAGMLICTLWTRYTNFSFYETSSLIVVRYAKTHQSKFNFPIYLKAVLHTLQQMLEMPSVGMNTYVSMMSKRGSDAFQHPRYGTSIVCCVLYALPEFLSDVNSVGVNSMFYGTPQVEVCRIKVW